MLGISINQTRLLFYRDDYVPRLKALVAHYEIDPRWITIEMIESLMADLPDKMRKEVEEVAVEAFKALGSSGNARIDFLINEETNKVYINEINSIPGSLAFYLWEAKGADFSSVLDEMINIGVKDYKKRVSKTHSFETNILQGFAAHGGVKGLKGMKGKLQ